MDVKKLLQQLDREALAAADLWEWQYQDVPLEVIDGVLRGLERSRVLVSELVADCVPELPDHHRPYERLYSVNPDASAEVRDWLQD